VDRHVIKGRGENRGKYLCYPRMAGLPPGGDHVWLPEQRKAARMDDPRYGGETYEKGLARKHNGYFVKIVAPKAIADRVDDLRSFIREHSACVEKLACYWLGGDFADVGNNYCHDCITEEAERLIAEKGLTGEDAEEALDDAIDGGFDISHDSTPYCETCGADLSGNLTDYGADEEIGAYTGECAPAFDEGRDWDRLDDALVNVSDDDPRWRAIARVVDAAAAAEREHEAKLAALAASPGMRETRTSLLSLLAVRAEQKAHEPSYKLWDEFQAWMPNRRDGKPETEATEKRLFKEAVRFLRFCGIPAYMTNGGMGMAKAPHGTYYWPFVVEAEQRRLWKDADLAAGRAVGLRCLDSDDAPSRDANPFEEAGHDSPRARAWEDGFLIGLHEASKAAVGAV
jgi:hypothetical protein